MSSNEKIKNADEFLDELDSAAVKVTEISKQYGVLDDDVIQDMIRNIETLVLLKCDDRQLAVNVFNRMDSDRQAAIRSNLMTRINEHKEEIDKFEKGELSDIESKPNIESLKKDLNECMEFAEDLGQKGS